MKSRIAFYTTLVFLTSITLPAFSDGWTTTPAEISRFYSSSDTSAWIRLALPVENVNSCNLVPDWFFIDNLDQVQGKTNFSVVELAYALNHKVLIHSSGCNSNNNYNTIRSVSLDRDHQ